jgi:hypothetical protein
MHHGCDRAVKEKEGSFGASLSMSAWMAMDWLGTVPPVVEEAGFQNTMGTEFLDDCPMARSDRGCGTR